MAGGAIGRKLGAGREAEVFEWDDDSVIKLYRRGYHGDRAEAMTLTQLDGLGLAPRLLELVEHDGRRGLVLERFRGPDMLTSLQRRPGRLGTLARSLADAHLAVHAVDAPAGLPDLSETLAQRIQDAPLSGELQTFALRILEKLPTGDRLCHGDYHPGNTLIDGNRVAVIDWSNAARGVPEADYARTLLLLRSAHPLPGTPIIFRGLMAMGRSLFARTYQRRYRRDATQPPRQVGAWLTVQSAARMGEGIESEYPRLIASLERDLNDSAPAI